MVNVNNRLLYICVGPLFKYLKMNILLDTNILIPLEDTRRILESSFAEMRKLSAEQQHCLLFILCKFKILSEIGTK